MRTGISNIGMGFGAAAYAHREAQGIAHPTDWRPGATTPVLTRTMPWGPNRGTGQVIAPMYQPVLQKPTFRDMFRGFGQYAGRTSEIGNITRANLMASGLSAARVDQMIGSGATEGMFSQRKKAGFLGFRRNEFLDAQGKALSAAEARSLGLGKIGRAHV